MRRWLSPSNSTDSQAKYEELGWILLRMQHFRIYILTGFHHKISSNLHCIQTAHLNKKPQKPTSVALTLLPPGIDVAVVPPSRVSSASSSYRNTIKR